MKNKSKFYPKVNNGVISPAIRANIADAIKTLDGKNIVITIEERSKRRSEKQNDFMWGFVIPPIKQMFEDAGTPCTPNDVHAFLKEHVLGMMKMMVLPDGTRRAVVESSTLKNTKEWEDNMEKIRAWAAGWGVTIPYPNENLDPPSWLDEVLEGQQLRDMRG